MMSVRDRFAQDLRNARKQRGLSQDKASELCGISVRQLQNLEAGDALPNLETALQIAYAFDLSLDAMCDEEDVRQRARKNRL